MAYTRSGLCSLNLISQGQSSGWPHPAHAGQSTLIHTTHMLQVCAGHTHSPVPGCRPGRLERGEGREKREQGCWLRKGITSPCTTPRGCQLPSTSPTQPHLLLVQGPWLDDEEMPKGGKGQRSHCRTHMAQTGPHLSPLLPPWSADPPPVIWAPEPCFLLPPPQAPWLTLQEHGYLLFSRQGPHQGSFRLLRLLLTCCVTLAHCSTSLALRNKGKAPSPQDIPNPLADRGFSLRPCGGEK